MSTQRFSGGFVRDEWDAKSVHYEPTPGIYALYQGGVLKYLGQSHDCADRIHHWRTASDPYFEEKKCHDWESGTDFTARILPLPGLSGGRHSPDEEMRKQWEAYWVFHLRPPCNRIIPVTEPPRPAGAETETPE